MPNRLDAATSPYLRQHADSPVDWWPWGAEAFAEARRRDVPVLVSIGYAACHWCHVMARESFADPVAGELVNRHFVAIKVDREEYPDVDTVFMQTTQTLTGQGGWPMTVFCTPAGQPFFAGTYFPPIARQGLPSFTELISALADAWQNRRAEVLESAAAIVAALGELDEKTPAPDHPLPTVPELLDALHDQYDTEHGGFGGAPKFPPAVVLDAMLVRTDQPNNDLALFTCEAMARGGIYDQVGGGFHRYAVDTGWEVPHFEKMLPDNALLLGTYTRAWLRAVPNDGTERRELFERVVRGIVGFLAGELKLADGGYAASLAADSPDTTGAAAEGAYYLWSPAQLDEVLGRDSRFAQGVCHVTHGGNLPMGAHAPTDGSGFSTLQLHGNPHPQRLARVLDQLKQARDQRPRPARDDKLVTAWQGLVIDSLVRAAMVFGERTWLAAARECAAAVWRANWQPDRGRLVRSSLLGVSGPDAVAADHAALALGYAGLAGALGDQEWLTRAETLLDLAIELFWDSRDGWHDAAPSPELFRQPCRLDDEATPSAVSLLVMAFRVVGRMTGRADLAAHADRAASQLRRVVTANPRWSGWGLADLLAGAENALGRGPAEVVIVADPDDPMSEMTRAAWRLAPWGSVVVTGPAGTPGFGGSFEGRVAVDGVPTAHVCRNGNCLLPITDWRELRAALWPN